VRVLPEFGPRGAPYWQALREHRFVVQNCGSCAHVQHPPLPRCVVCGESELPWRDFTPEGTLYAFAVVHHATHLAFADEVPYAVGLVEVLPEVRVVARLTGNPDLLRIGMPMTGVFRDLDDDVTLLDFTPI
jgi:uncharacterized OB-fold protein